MRDFRPDTSTRCCRRWRKCDGDRLRMRMRVLRATPPLDAGIMTDAYVRSVRVLRMWPRIESACQRSAKQCYARHRFYRPRPGFMRRALTSPESRGVLQGCLLVLHKKKSGKDLPWQSNSRQHDHSTKLIMLGMALRLTFSNPFVP